MSASTLMQTVQFKRIRHWCSPIKHPFVQKVTYGVAKDALEFQCNLRAARLASLYDHKVGLLCCMSLDLDIDI